MPKPIRRWRFHVSFEPELLVKLDAGQRFQITFRGAIGWIAAIGTVAGATSTGLALFEAVEKLNEIRLRGGALDLFVTTAYAAATVVEGPASAGLLKSVILAGIFLALFILFVWALVTLYKSPNATAVGVAGEAVKMLSGFFIGALTGFLGA